MAGVLPLSSSLSVYRGQEGYMDQLSKKMQNETGLRDHHAHAWQVSCCPEQPRAAPNPEPRAPSATLAPALAALTTWRPVVRALASASASAWLLLTLTSDPCTGNRLHPRGSC